MGTPLTLRQASGLACPCSRCCAARWRWVLQPSLHRKSLLFMPCALTHTALRRMSTEEAFNNPEFTCLIAL